MSWTTYKGPFVFIFDQHWLFARSYITTYKFEIIDDDDDNDDDDYDVYDDNDDDDDLDANHSAVTMEG